MNKLLIFSIFLISIVQANEVLSLNYCKNKLKERFKVIESEVYVFEKYLDDDVKLRSQQIEDAITQQLNYINPFYLANENKNVFSKPTDLNIKNIKLVTQKFKFKIDNKDFSFEQSKYYSKLLNNPPQYGDDVKLLKVNYTAQIGEVYCSNEEKIEEVWLPRFPYLAYWYIGKDERKLYYYRTGKSDIVNPCATDELADFNKPYFFWYFWNPMRESSEDLCENKYLNNVDNIKLKVVSITPSKKIKNINFAQINKINIIYGNLKQELSLEDIEKINNAYENNKFNDHNLLFNQLNFFKLLTTLRDKYQFKVLNWTYLKDHILVTLKNNYKEINLFVGSTDEFSSLGATHKKFMNDSLYNSDMLIYWGHAGLGMNFEFDKKIDQNRLKIKQLALLSCYSYRYFVHNNLYKTNKLDGVFYTGNDLLTGYKEILNVLSLTLNEKGNEIYGNDGYTFFKSL